MQDISFLIPPRPGLYLFQMDVFWREISHQLLLAEDFMGKLFHFAGTSHPVDVFCPQHLGDAGIGVFQKVPWRKRGVHRDKPPDASNHLLAV